MSRRDVPTKSTSVVIPRASDEYDSSFMNNMIKAIQNGFEDLRAPPMLRGGELFLNNLPTRGATLPVGYVFADAGVLKIVRKQDIFADSFSLTVSSGKVTVST